MARAPTYSNEGDVKREIKKLLDKHNWFWWMPPGNGFGTTGVADFNAVRAGVFLAVEAKFDRKPTAMQIAFLRSVGAEDSFGFVVDEKRIDLFAAWLAAFDRACEAAARKQEPTAEDGALMLNTIRAMTQEIA